MNYNPNTIHWRKDDIVLHDADAKEPKMFMVVIGYTRDGLCKTQYVDKRERKRTIWKNELKYLHDIGAFGLSRHCKQDDFELVRWWNKHYDVGTSVRVTDAIIDQETRTRSCAQHIKGAGAYIFLEGIVGAYMLAFVHAIEPITP